VNATGVTAGPAESNGSLLLGIWRDSLHVTCGLTALHRDQLRAQRSVTSMGKLYLFTYICGTGKAGRFNFDTRIYCGIVLCQLRDEK